MSSSRRARRRRRRLKRKKIARRELAKDLLHAIAGRPKNLFPEHMNKYLGENMQNWYASRDKLVEIGFIHSVPAGGSIKKSLAKSGCIEWETS